LDGSSKFFPWKVEIILLLEETDIRDIIKDVPTPTDLQQVMAHEKKEVKAKWMNLDVMKDHPILHISQRQQQRRCLMPWLSSTKFQILIEI